MSQRRSGVPFSLSVSVLGSWARAGSLKRLRVAECTRERMDGNGCGRHISNSLNCKSKWKLYLRNQEWYRVTHQVGPNIQLTSKEKLQLILKRNFCFDVNGMFGSTWCVTCTRNLKPSPNFFLRLFKWGVYKYRDRLKGLYVVSRILFLLLLTCSAWPSLGPF